MTINSSLSSTTSTQTYIPSTVAHLPNKMHFSAHSAPIPVAAPPPSDLRGRFISQYKDLHAHKRGDPVILSGQSLTVAAITAVARYHAPLVLDGSQEVKDKLIASRRVIVDKVEQSKSVYGVSTGFGGSADTRTDNPLALGAALLQHQQSGVLPSSTDAPLPVLPLLDPMTSTTMPESWVRGAILVRINSLLRGHSGVRLELIEKMADLIMKNITPVVPIRGSVSASGDLAPLSYVAGTLVGNPAIRVFDGTAAFGSRSVVPSREALAKHGLTPIKLGAKEHLGILNGTAFSTSVAALALNDAVHLALLAQVCTAMGTEALNGMRGSFAPFIHKEARPHPGQVEAANTIWELLEGSKFAVGHEEEVTIDEDAGELRQDRYPLRTAPQFLGPQIEDILAAYDSISLEANSTTDNPLINAKTGEVHHGGNFQAMAVSNAMEKTRLSLHHIGKLLFAQTAELVNPQQNRGLPPSLAASDPSHNYHGKGIDIAAAAYVGELGYLANPVSTHVQSAEMHNQAVNSLALISARATLNSLDVLSMLIASYLYLLCQAYDLRALQAEFKAELVIMVTEELDVHFPGAKTGVLAKALDAMYRVFDNTSTMDAAPRMGRLSEAAAGVLLHYYTDTTFDVAALAAVPAFRASVSKKATDSLIRLRREYLHGEHGPAPATKHLIRTRPMYEFVRKTLGIRMHGAVNETNFKDEFGGEDSIGQNVSLIHEAIRDGKLQGVVVDMLA